ncbi:3-oxoacyl-[acyl-carrier-protein] reductase FabG-like [Episyrphus balteatus]|uniref:3-oxoacyl-[acyl-carrier-protein] reductase FabG-like n=1 Tax=Episyrphus balteatus TaxID=286459 RepID=UPI00248562E7|nr:3-oxoacyl-[acyl-carrier-protein] reductase FabG-like [Episyrphus balteatus]
MLRLAEKVAIITGASSGIGAETCIQFAKNGAHIVAVGRNFENLKQTQNSCMKINPNVKCLLIQADVTKDTKKIVDQTIAEFEKIDVLVNNAGILANGGILDMDVEQLDTVMDVNLRSVFQLTKLVLPHLIKSKGNVVNVSSVTGIRSFPYVLSYCVSKAALDQFTKCVALEMAQHNVRVNSVNPGTVVTEIHKRGGMDEKSYAEFLKHGRDTHAMGRVGNVSEVAPAIVFLASEEASFITGALLSIDGGKGIMCPR